MNKKYILIVPLQYLHQQYILRLCTVTKNAFGKCVYSSLENTMTSFIGKFFLNRTRFLSFFISENGNIYQHFIGQCTKRWDNNIEIDCENVNCIHREDIY
jgi:hypothetical protein